MPLAPVGGWMWAESPARKSRPHCIGSTTKLRMGVMPFCSIAPSASLRVRPVLDVVVRGALQVEPCQGRRAHGVKRKAALVIGIDQLVFGRRRFGQNPDPAEWIFAIIG